MKLPDWAYKDYRYVQIRGAYPPKKVHIAELRDIPALGGIKLVAVCGVGMFRVSNVRKGKPTVTCLNCLRWYHDKMIQVEIMREGQKDELPAGAREVVGE